MAVLCSAQITLYDAIDTVHVIDVIGGKRSYNYTAEGQKPNANDDLGEFSFRLLENGKEVDLVTAGLTISWSVPENSMITGSSSELTFRPRLINEYSDAKQNNSIILSVIYDGSVMPIATIPIIISKIGGQAKSVRIYGDQVFKYGDNEDIPTPDAITLEAVVQNIKPPYYPKWEVVGRGGNTIIDSTTGVIFSGDNTNNPKITIPYNFTLFTGDSMTIRATINGIYDQVTLYKVKDGQTGEQGRSYRYRGEWHYDTLYGNEIKYIDTVSYNGDLYECREEVQYFNPIEDTISWRLMIKSPELDAELDWIKDWSSNKTEINEEYIVTPKIFAGINGNPGGEAILTGISIGKDVFGTTDASMGIVGYNGAKRVSDATFHLKVDGSAWFGRDPKRRFIVKPDGTISTPEITADTIKGGTLSLGGNFGEVSGNEGIRERANGVIKVFKETFDLSNKTQEEIDMSNEAIVTIDKKGIQMNEGVIRGQKMLMDVTNGSMVVGGNSVSTMPQNGIIYHNGQLRLRASTIEFQSGGDYTDMDGFKDGIDATINDNILPKIEELNDKIQNDITDAMTKVEQQLTVINEKILNMGEDGVITPTEKAELKRQLQEIKTEYPIMKKQAEMFFKGAIPPENGDNGNLEVGSNKIHPVYQSFIDGYQSSYETLNNYLTANGSGLLGDMTIDSPITVDPVTGESDLSRNFNNYYTKKVELMEAMTTVNKNFASMFKMDATGIEMIVGSKNQENGKWNADNLLSSINLSPGTATIRANQIKLQGGTTFEGYASGLAKGTTYINGGSIYSGIITLGGTRSDTTGFEGYSDPQLIIKNSQNATVTNLNKNGIATEGNFVIGNTDPNASVYDLKFTKSGGLTINASTININTGRNFNVKSGGNINIESGGNFKMVSGGNFTIDAGGRFSLTSSNVEIGTNKFILKNSSNVALLSFNGSSLTLGSDVTLDWSQVSSKPSIPTTSGIETIATRITKDTVTTSYVNALGVTANSVSSRWVYAGDISASQITTGTIDANRLIVNKIQRTNNSTIYLEIDGGHADLTIHKGSSIPFQVYDSIDGVSLRSYGKSFLTVGSNGTVSFPNGASVTAKFG